MRKLRHKALLLVISVALTTSAISGWSSYHSNAKLIEAGMQTQLQTAVRLIQDSIQEETNKAAAHASLVSAIPTVQQLLRAKDQQKLAEELVPAFVVQRDQFGVREGQFHLPPAFSFLRLLGETISMEDLSGFREMVLATNRRHETQRGIEIGEGGLSIRGISVVKDAQGPIGSFEVGLSFSTVLQDVKDLVGTEAGVFINDRLMTTIATALPPADRERIIGGYRNVEATNWTVLRPLVTADLLTRANDVTYQWQTVNGVPFGIVVVPLLDFKGSRIGAVVAARSFESSHAQHASALVRALALALLQTVLLVGAVLIAFNGMLMRPISRLGKMLLQLADGDPHINVGDLGKRQDEVGSMARSIETVSQALGTQNQAQQERS